MFLIIKLILFLTVPLLTSSKIDYCELCIETPRQHTLCLYRPQCPHIHGTECPVKCPCGKLDQKPLTQEQKDEILDRHNKYRSRVATGGNCHDTPTAANMNQLEWDDELEEIARCWANQCELRTDICRDIEQGYVGQNYGSRIEKHIHLISSTQVPLAIIDEWFEQRRYYNPDDLGRYQGVFSRKKNCYPNHSINDTVSKPKPIDNYNQNCLDIRTKCYTQLIWAETRRIGCARICFEVNNEYRCNLFCNYFPGGNLNNHPVYGRGAPASKCESGRRPSEQYDGLCI